MKNIRLVGSAPQLFPVDPFFAGVKIAYNFYRNNRNRGSVRYNPSALLISLLKLKVLSFQDSDFFTSSSERPVAFETSWGELLIHSSTCLANSGSMILSENVMMPDRTHRYAVYGKGFFLHPISQDFGYNILILICNLPHIHISPLF